MILEMNKLKFVLLFISTGIFNNGFTQLNDFYLSKYKLPDLERHSLVTNFNVSGYNNYYKDPNQTYIGMEKYRTNQYNGDIYLNYNHCLNNSEYQRKTYLGLDFSSDFNNRK
jgi:hypothetical protein